MAVQFVDVEVAVYLRHLRGSTYAFLATAAGAAAFTLARNTNHIARQREKRETGAEG